jgi:hypothetical protein
MRISGGARVESERSVHQEGRWRRSGHGRGLKGWSVDGEGMTVVSSQVSYANVDRSAAN